MFYKYQNSNKEVKMEFQFYEVYRVKKVLVEFVNTIPE